MSKVYLVLDAEHEYVQAVFSSEAEAVAYADGNNVESMDVWDVAPPLWTHYVRGASVYPDSTYEEWASADLQKGVPGIEAVDDHLNNRPEPWDGHTQSHCGEHIYVSGTDKDGVERSFQAHLVAALARQTGVCQARHHKHRGAIDGTTVFESGFMKARAAHTGAEMHLACYPWAEHEYGPWSEWRDVEQNCRNRQRVCARCCSCEIAVSGRHSG